MTNKTKYLIGQSVIVDGTQIATVIPHPKGVRDIELATTVWVRLYNGVEQYRALHNVEPLPSCNCGQSETFPTDANEWLNLIKSAISETELSSALKDPEAHAEGRKLLPDAVEDLNATMIRIETNVDDIARSLDFMASSLSELVLAIKSR